VPSDASDSVGCSKADQEVKVDREQSPEARAGKDRRMAIVEELRKAELVRDRLEALDRITRSYPQGHAIRERLEALGVDRELEAVEEDIRGLWDRVQHPRGT
jgi:hypothetical protein